MIGKMLISLLSVDVKSLIAVLFWGNLSSVSLILSYNRTSKNSADIKLARYYVAAKLFQAAAYFFIYFRGEIIDILSINLGNLFMLGGFYLESRSILMIVREESPAVKNLVGIIALFSAVCFNIAERIFHDSSIRITLMSIFLFLILVVPCIKLLISPKASRFKKTVGVYYIFLLSLLLPRAFYTFSHLNVDIFSNFLIQSLTFLALILLMIYGLSAYLLLMKENADRTIKTLAMSDSLTGLLNRQSFEDAAEELFERQKKDQAVAAVLFMDIDHFKKVNDNHGHQFGDQVIRRLAEIIRITLREQDLSCRYGGEEFVIFLGSSKSAAGMRTAQRIMAEIRKSVFPEKPEFRFTASIGIVWGVPQQDDRLDDFMNRADQALYEAKETGRDRIVQQQFERTAPAAKLTGSRGR